MAKRGLGRGLDALIPDKGASSAKGTGEKKNGKKKAAGETKKSGNKSSAAKTADKKETVKAAEKPAVKSESGKSDAEKPATAKMTERTTATAADAAVKGSSLRTDAEQKQNKVPEEGRVIQMRTSLVEPNRGQPRKYFDEEAIAELADSIRQFGVIQPLIVQKKDGYYEIIAGERRWRAAKAAGLTEVPVIVRNYSGQEAVEVALIENIQREDLNPIEEAKAYQQLVSEYGMSQEAVAGRVSRSRSAVANSLRLLKLSPEIQSMVETSQLSEGHARALLGLGSQVLQDEAAQTVLKEHLSVRQTEKLVRSLLAPAKKRKPHEVIDRLLLNDLEEKMKSSLGTKVSIRATSSKKGKIEIEYYSADELDRIYELLLSVRS